MTSTTRPDRLTMQQKNAFNIVDVVTKNSTEYIFNAGAKRGVVTFDGATLPEGQKIGWYMGPYNHYDGRKITAVIQENVSAAVNDKTVTVRHIGFIGQVQYFAIGYTDEEYKFASSVSGCVQHEIDNHPDRCRYAKVYRSRSKKTFTARDVSLLVDTFVDTHVKHDVHVNFSGVYYGDDRSVVYMISWNGKQEDRVDLDTVISLDQVQEPKVEVSCSTVTFPPNVHNSEEFPALVEQDGCEEPEIVIGNIEDESDYDEKSETDLELEKINLQVQIRQLKIREIELKQKRKK